MAVIRLMNQANIPSAQFDILSKAVQHYVPLVVAAWKLNACTVEAKDLQTIFGGLNMDPSKPATAPK